MESSKTTEVTNDELLERFSEFTGEVDERGSEAEEPAKTVRRGYAIDPESYALANKRAENEGVSMSAVARTLVKGYGLGKYDLPELKEVYPEKENEVTVSKVEESRTTRIRVVLIERPRTPIYRRISNGINGILSRVGQFAVAKLPFSRRS